MKKIVHRRELVYIFYLPLFLIVTTLTLCTPNSLALFAHIASFSPLFAIFFILHSKKATDTPRYGTFIWLVCLIAGQLLFAFLMWSLFGAAQHTAFSNTDISNMPFANSPLAWIFHSFMWPWLWFALLSTLFSHYRFTEPGTRPLFNMVPSAKKSSYFAVFNLIMLRHGLTLIIAFALAVNLVELWQWLFNLLKIPFLDIRQVMMFLLFAFAYPFVVSKRSMRLGYRISQLHWPLGLILFLTLLIFSVLMILVGHVFALPNPLSFAEQMNQRLLATPIFQFIANLPFDALWKIFFWSTIILSAPYFAIFLAKISEGRSLRQRVLGVLLLPVFLLAMATRPEDLQAIIVWQHALTTHYDAILAGLSFASIIFYLLCSKDATKLLANSLATETSPKEHPLPTSVSKTFVLTALLACVIYTIVGLWVVSLLSFTTAFVVCFLFVRIAWEFVRR